MHTVSAVFYTSRSERKITDRDLRSKKFFAVAVLVKKNLLLG